MTDNQDFQVVVGGLISSDSSDYEMQAILGSGSFGQVVQCKKLATNETVALKVIKPKKSIDAAKDEEFILQLMKDCQSENYNIVKWHDSFTYKGRYCHEFEKLDISLYEFRKKNIGPLKLSEIRPVIHQLATALNFLEGIGVIHADLKPENIMMVDHINEPLRVKIIDFGLSITDPKKWIGSNFQTLWYRSPEIMLGNPFNEAIDVWSLGCIAAEMMLGAVLFPGRDRYDMMRHIIRTIGKPPDHLLETGLFTKRFYRLRQSKFHPSAWIFLLPFEAGHFNLTPCTINSLSDMDTPSFYLSREDVEAAACDRVSFVDLVTKMLKVDPAERITSGQILEHPFLTMSHIVGKLDNSLYVKMSVDLMNTIQEMGSNESQNETLATLETETLTSAGSASQAYISAPDDDRTAWLFLPKRSSPAQKRKWDSDDDSSDSRSPDSTRPKKRRTECLDEARTETGGRAAPQKSLLPKRKRDDADMRTTSEGNSPARKRKAKHLNEQLKETPGDHLKKRKMADEEVSCSKQEKTFPVNRKTCVDKEEGEPASKKWSPKPKLRLDSPVRFRYFRAENDLTED